MFDELIKELCRLDGQEVSVSIPSDADGYFDRECPRAACQFKFKVHKDDWHEKVRDEEVHCPFYGHTAHANAWRTQEQFKHAKKTALARVDHRINGAMRRDADQWNRHQARNSFIDITMKVDSRPLHLPLPPAAVEPMQLKITCPECECRYAVIGAAFFCPACGHNAADLVFSQTLAGIRKVLSSLADIKATIRDRDTAATAARLYTENGLQNAVTAFQRFAEALYSTLPSSQPPRRNAFQNLKEGNALWHSATGKQSSACLSSAELKALSRYFQQRHLLAHTQGIVDADYINRTRDTDYRIGQRIVVHETTVHDCVALIEKLATGMTSDIPPTRESES